MNTVGIIAEYNPFHTGHAYHIRKAKELTRSDCAVVIMSPDFVQRGEPAIFDKYARAEMALRCGADLVIELPVCYATGSAEYFARGAVTMLDRLGAVDALCFGAETDSAQLFETVASLLCDEPQPYRESLRESLRQGKTFPQARSDALCAVLTDRMAEAGLSEASAALSRFLETPNNILGIEYCKALRHLRSRMEIVPVARRGNSYDSKSLSGSFCSATALRETILDESEFLSDELLSDNTWARMKQYIPEECWKQFRALCAFPMTSQELDSCLTLRLLDDAVTGSIRCEETAILDLSSELADRMGKLRYELAGKTYREAVARLKTRQLTEARIRRALLHLILNIRTDDVKQYLENGTVFYARVLGFRKSAAPLLHEIKKRSVLPLITKTANASFTPDGCAARMWESDVYASHLYRSIRQIKYNIPFRTEYEYSPVIIP